MSESKFEFDKALGELEEITQWFEGTNVDLDQGLVKFERGMELASQLKTHLTSVENRVEKIKARFAAPPAPASDVSVDTADEADQTDLFD